MITGKDLTNKKNILGQFLTNDKIASFCLDKIVVDENLIIEPSCGKGIFLDKMRQKYPNAEILGIELDTELIASYLGDEKIIEQNFYDFSEHFSQDICFIGNPPYRTPAYSLRSHSDYIKELVGKYEISGIKEEAVFFIIKTVDLIKESKVGGSIHYILPKSIFTNDSKAYKTFIRFLKANLTLVSVWDVNDFEDVGQSLVFVSFRLERQSADAFVWNGKKANLEDFYGCEDYTPFQRIFKKTYLGSVPCESIFLSVKDEPKECFAQRLQKLFDAKTCVDENNLVEYLSYNGEPHLRDLKTGKREKIKTVLSYVQQVKNLAGYNHSLFFDMDNYKCIKHRKEERFYFRHEFLKKAKFIYIINSNPCPSFYFPGNPVKNTTDYFGYCEYDVNRNGSPGALRCVPINDLENNLHDDFKRFWNETNLPYDKLFDYILHIAKSDWYAKMKSKYHRFYFGIPTDFDQSFIK